MLNFPCEVSAAFRATTDAGESLGDWCLCNAIHIFMYRTSDLHLSR